MAVDPQASPFWRAALRSGLVEAGGLDTCLAGIDLASGPPEAFDRRLARRAVEAGLLTPWQARQLSLGRWQGLVIGKYALLDVLGRGGMGRVYLARDTRLRRPVALKVLSRQRGGDRRAAARFEREARVGGQLQHENLIRVYDDGEVFGHRYLVMEYVDGTDAARLVAGRGPLPPAHAAELARQVALGLDHLHRKGLLHRDVSPANVLVDRDGTVKLTDLGLAFELGDAENLTREGSTVGNFDYISPEQCRSSHAVDIRSDLYSLGCSLYHLIAGRVPFPAAGLAEKLYAHQEGEPEPLGRLAPGCPEGLEAAVRRMMRKSPAERYATPAEVARALAPFAAGPEPLGRVAVAAEGSRSQGGCADAEADAYAAEWIETGLGLGPGNDARWSPGLGDVFCKVDLDDGPPQPASTTPDFPPVRRVLTPVMIAAVALAVLAGLLVILLGARS